MAVQPGLFQRQGDSARVQRKSNGRPSFRIQSARGGRELFLILGVVVVLFLCLSFVPTPSFSNKHVKEVHTTRIYPKDIVTSSLPIPSLKVLLSTHNRLFWYFPDTGVEVTLHDGQVLLTPRIMKPVFTYTMLYLKIRK